MHSDVVGGLKDCRPRAALFDLALDDRLVLLHPKVADQLVVLLREEPDVVEARTDDELSQGASVGRCRARLAPGRRYPRVQEIAKEWTPIKEPGQREASPLAAKRTSGMVSSCAPAPSPLLTALLRRGRQRARYELRGRVQLA
jgi:hypothetical protein